MRLSRKVTTHKKMPQKQSSAAFFERYRVTFKYRSLNNGDALKVATSGRLTAQVTTSVAAEDLDEALVFVNTALYLRRISTAAL